MSTATSLSTKVSRLPSGLSSQENLANLSKEEEQMTVIQTGASSHNEVNWHEINWRAVNGNVRRLQMRIVKPDLGKGLRKA